MAKRPPPRPPTKDEADLALLYAVTARAIDQRLWRAMLVDLAVRHYLAKCPQMRGYFVHWEREGLLRQCLTGPAATAVAGIRIEFASISRLQP